jgi:hypothetical protein
VSKKLKVTFKSGATIKVRVKDYNFGSTGNELNSYKIVHTAFGRKAKYLDLSEIVAIVEV